MSGDASQEQVNVAAGEHQTRTAFVGLKIGKWEFDRDNIADLKRGHRFRRPLRRLGKSSQGPAAANRGLRGYAQSIAADPCKAGVVQAKAKLQLPLQFRGAFSR